MPFILWLELQGFYASCHPAGDKPLVVVRDKLVLDANAAARKRQVAPGMCAREAGTLLPSGSIKAWNREAYVERQTAWLDLCVDFSGIIEPIDQHIAAVDLSGHPEPYLVAARLVDSLESGTKLPVRYGAAGTKWVARLAAEREDPNGIAWKDPESFLADLSVGDLLPAKPETRQRLAFLGYHTIGQAAQVRLEVLRRQFGEEALLVRSATQGKHLQPVLALYPLDSMQECLIFDGAVDDLETIERGLRSIAGRIGRRLSEQGKSGTKVRMEIETETDREQRARTFTKPVSDPASALGALKLLISETPAIPVLAIRVSVLDLETVRNRQSPLIGTVDRFKRPDPEAAVHVLRKTFGDASVQLASEVEVPRRVRVLREWQNASGWR